MVEKTKFDIPRPMGSCKACKYVGSFESQVAGGGSKFVSVCHKEPPKVFAIAIPQQNPANPKEQGVVWMSTAAWPDVRDEDWCGFFTARDSN